VAAVAAVAAAGGADGALSGRRMASSLESLMHLDCEEN